MHLTHLRQLLSPGEGISKLTALAWAPNNGRLAAASYDRVVHLFDERGERRDKFKTKPVDPDQDITAGSGAYYVSGMAYSPDSTKLAIAQSDGGVFVYRLGAEWSDKKSICNKFTCPSAVTCISWPAGRPSELIFGGADGRIRVGSLKSNRISVLQSHSDGSYVTCLVSSPDSSAFLSGHADGTVQRCNLPGAASSSVQVAGLQLQHSCAPSAVSWGSSGICITGPDCRVAFLDAAGSELQVFDFSADAQAHGFACISMNVSGDIVIVGATDRLYAFRLAAGVWAHVATKQATGTHGTTALAWRPDGSALTAGTLTGGVDLYDVCLRRVRHRGKLELSYVSSTTVIVKSLISGACTVVSSTYGHALGRITVHQERYLISRTPATLLLGNLDTCRLSEIAWPHVGGGERFSFDNERLCLVLRCGELSVIEYGVHEPLATCRTDHASPYLLSAAAMDACGTAPAARRLAYLVDAYTLRVIDMLGSRNAAAGAASGDVALATITHERSIDWLELNMRGSHLLFRDKRRRLYLCDLASQTRSCLLDFCAYVQWVPGSDVIVAQGIGTLYVWYSLKHPDRVTGTPIKGEVQGIERGAGRTEVLVEDGLGTVAHLLDESLIDFGAALEDMDLQRAVATLEARETTPATEAQWAQLAGVALQAQALAVAERCYAALGDVPRARYLHKVVKAVTSQGEPIGIHTSLPPSARSALALLDGQWHVAEALLLAQGQVDEAIEMYQQANRWDDVVRIADTSRLVRADELRKARNEWLMTSGQEDRAAQLREQGGDHLGAISLYLKAGLPARAAQVIISGCITHDSNLIDSICLALSKSNLHERLGELLQHLGRHSEALDAYRRGNAYRKAVDLARAAAPAAVVGLEEAWGDWLAGQRQHDAAVHHYIEAGATIKALEAAMGARQLAQATGILEHLEPDKATPYCRRLAKLNEDAGNREGAERQLLRAGAPVEAVEMWLRSGNWDAAHKVARGYMDQAQLKAFYGRHAQECQAAGRWADAERSYLACGDVDAAAAMYSTNRQWAPLLKLIASQRREQLPAVHIQVAQALQAEGAWRDAERHFCEAKEWRAAVNMHSAQAAWDDALRVAKVFGGPGAASEVAYAWAITLPSDSAAALLRRLGMADGAVEHALDVGDYEHAYQLASAAVPGKLPEVHYKYAMSLEDAGRFAEAEAEFIQAGKPREAIDMHVHNQDWAAALRVAEGYDPTSIMDVLAAQANAAAGAQQYTVAEGLFLKAKRPEAALAMYRTTGQWQAALRIAESYLPGRVQEVNLEMAAALASPGGVIGGGGGPDSAVAVAITRARAYEAGNDVARAIDTYLELGPGDSPDADVLQQCWEQAAQLAMVHLRHRLHEVVTSVAQRLTAIGRAAAAAELQDSIGDAQGAVVTLCAAGLYERAQALAGGNAALLAHVDAQHTAALLAASDADGLAARGNAAAAVELYAAQGDWERAHKLAAEAGPELMASLAVRHAALLLRQGEWGSAAAVLAKPGIMCPDPKLLQLCRDVALEVLSAPAVQRSTEAEEHVCVFLRRIQEILRTLATALQERVDSAGFARLAEAAQLTVLACRASAASLHELAARQLTGRMRSIGIIPADRAFYEAGAAWRAAGHRGMALVLLNRYLDVADAMEEQDQVHAGQRSSPGGLADLDNSDLAATDVPVDVPLPAMQHIGDAAREEVRDYVLELSMDRSVCQELRTVPCERCGSDIYEARLSCTACGTAWSACAISGYPVTAAERIPHPSTAGVMLRRSDWNAWVAAFGKDPLSGGPATPQ